LNREGPGAKSKGYVMKGQTNPAVTTLDRLLEATQIRRLFRPVKKWRLLYSQHYVHRRIETGNRNEAERLPAAPETTELAQALDRHASAKSAASGRLTVQLWFLTNSQVFR
jgi:hypothetical protein